MSLHEDTNLLNLKIMAENVKNKGSGKMNVNSKSSKSNQSFSRSNSNINRNSFSWKPGHRKPIQNIKEKFEGDTKDLKGYYFDCTTQKQTKECTKTL